MTHPEAVLHIGIDGGKHQQAEQRRQVGKGMETLGETGDRQHHQLHDPQGTCNQHRSYQRVIMRLATREDMLHHCQDIRLVEIEITKGKTQEDQRTHDVHECAAI